VIKDSYEGNISLESINSSYITLIPKVETPLLPGDFRPISLLNSVLKIVTKFLANRLQNIILNLVHKNQYGFLKTKKNLFKIALDGLLSICSNVTNQKKKSFC
jgi:hypothetical protein